jgi:soluble lytic murein transglycosylase-like protein
MPFAVRYKNCPFLFLLTPVILVLGVLSVAHALPIYTDGLSLQKPENTSPENKATRNRAEQIRRVTQYIQKTFQVAPHKTIAIITEAIYNGRKHNLQPELILAVIAVESTFRENAVSIAGARGLMQIMPGAHPQKVKAVGGSEALFQLKRNIATGTAILNEYLQRSDGDLQKALLRYNGSLSDPDSSYSDKVLRVFNKLKEIIGPGGLS